MNHHPLQLLAAALVLGHASLALASTNSVTVFPAEGNKQCSDYSANSLIKQMGTSKPVASGTVTGPENPKDADTTGESAAYALAGGTVASFSAATTPIDYAILKSGSNVSVIIYPSGGVLSDRNMKLTVNGLDKTIDAISLCYGLGNVAPPPPPPTTIPSCEDLNNAGGLDHVMISCPADGSSSIIYNFELDNTHFYNTNGTPLACVCNRPALLECNPNVPYDALNPGNGACPQPMGDKTGAEVTTHIELNNDPYVCTTVGGIRKCYSY